MQCPYIYFDGIKCSGEITSLTLVKTNIDITLNDGEVVGIEVKPKYVYLHCTHAGYSVKSLLKHPESVRVSWFALPKEIRDRIGRVSNELE